MDSFINYTNVINKAFQIENQYLNNLYDYILTKSVTDGRSTFNEYIINSYDNMIKLSSAKYVAT